MRERQQQHFGPRQRILAMLSILLTVCLAATVRAEDLTSRKFTFDIPVQPLSSAILSFSAQTGIQIVTDGADVSALKTQGVSGQLSAREALTRILTGTGLQHRAVGKTAVALTRNAQSSSDSAVSGAATRVAQAGAAATADTPKEGPTLDAAAVRIPEVLVVGSRILNMDIPRSRDDVQPYVIFDRAAIERSGATTVDDFLKQRLAMNTVGESNDQVAGVSTGSTSSINLRGLGASQTLILIDGHRMPTINLTGNIKQGDINGIPLAAIERIEILPATASGIYGGSATGGVINIVRRRDYSGLESRIYYENTLDTDAALRRVDVSAGFNLEGGRTNVMLVGNYSDGNSLLAQDRDLIQRGRGAILANNPAGLLPPNTAPLGTTTNIRSATLGPGGVPVNLTLDSGTPLNSSFTSVPAGYGGAASDNGQALLANAGIYNLGLANSAQTGGGRAALLNTPTIESLTATIRREFGDRIQAFIDASASNNNGYMPASVAASNFTIPAAAPNE